MCDTLVALGRSTADGRTLFGKNSDRQRNESQAVEIVPGGEHTPDAEVRCTYRTISEAKRTYTVLICRPYWMWGAEMGANEKGVVIGNEGLLSSVPSPIEEALTGMDLVRLALARSASADEAVQQIANLLDAHGQGGNCGHMTPAYYHNGFLIADATEAFVMETVGREWVLERVTGIRALSNAYSIGRCADRVSREIADLVNKHGDAGENCPDYAQALADRNTQHIGSAGHRRERGTTLLQTKEPSLRPSDLFTALRDHDTTGRTGESWDPKRSSGYSLCVHAGDTEHDSQTVGSLVSSIGPNSEVHWVTATAAPCLSIFKPILLEVPIPEHGPALNAAFNPKSLWWKHEQMHRSAIFGDFAQFLRDIVRERDALEAQFQVMIDEVQNGGDNVEKKAVVDACWRLADEVERQWQDRLPRSANSLDGPFTKGWEAMNRIARLPG